MRRLVLVFAITALGGCGPRPASAPSDGRGEGTGGLRVYDCAEGVALLVRGAPRARRVDVAWGDRRAILARVPADGFLFYAGEGADLAFGDDAARFTPEGGASLRCRRGARAERIERAAAEGALVWAVGNEPGWWLTLYPDRLDFEGDYGETRDRGAVVETRREGASTLYVARAGAHELVVRVTPRLCQDGMSGAPFAAEVVVGRDHAEYRGCGLLLGP